jgi:hypothetical protein
VAPGPGAPPLPGRFHRGFLHPDRLGQLALAGEVLGFDRCTGPGVDNAALDRLGIVAPRLHHGEGAATWPMLEQGRRLGRDVRIGLDLVGVGQAASASWVTQWRWGGRLLGAINH